MTWLNERTHMHLDIVCGLTGSCSHGHTHTHKDSTNKDSTIKRKCIPPGFELTSGKLKEKEKGVVGCVVTCVALIPWNEREVRCLVLYNTFGQKAKEINISAALFI